MSKASESLIQDILNLKNKPAVKTAGKAPASPIDQLTDTLLKLAEEMESEEEKEEKEEKSNGEGGKGSETSENEKESEGEDKSASQAEDIVAAALAELDNSKSASKRGEPTVKIDYTKLAEAILKKAVDGTGVYGLDADMTAAPKAEPGNVADEAKADAAKRTSAPNADDPSMGVQGPVDPMKGYSPQAKGGEDTPLTPGEIKSAMAKMSDSDITTFFKLAQVGYEVAADVLSDMVVEKQAQERIIETANRVKAAQAYQYLVSQGIDPRTL